MTDEHVSSTVVGNDTLDGPPVTATLNDPVHVVPPPSGAGSNRRRRSTASPQQKTAVASIVVLGALAGALSSGAPTGHTWVDTVYRAAFVALIAIAASRARRWSLITASGIASAASIGFALYLALTAFALAIFLVGRDQRNRVYGAAIGVLIGLALLRLEVTWFLGSSALVSAIASGLVFWSGYRTAKRRTRQQIRWAMAGAVVMVVVGAGLAAYEALTFRSTLEAAVNTTSKAVASLQAGKTQEAEAGFASASKAFAEVADESGQPWFFPTGLVPIVSQNVEVISVLSGSGSELASAAQSSAARVDYGRLRREGGGINLDVLAEFAEPVKTSADRLGNASLAVDDLQAPWVVEPLAEKVEQFGDKVTELKSQADLASLAVDLAPGLLGADGPRRYLVLVGNPAEARDIGGHIGNWAELVVADGALKLEQVGRPLELSQPALEAVLPETGDFPESVLAMKPATFPQNWGSSLDFRTDARLATKLFEQATGRKIDGVLYTDPFVLAAMLSITGPVPAPSINRSVSEADAVKFLTLDQFTLYDQSSEADTAITELTRDLFSRFTSVTLPGPREMSEKFGPLVKSGRLRLVSVHKDDAPLLARLGLNNGFSETEGSDLFAVVNRNANPSKIDSFLRRDTLYEVKWNPDSGEITAHVTVDLSNDAPASGLPPYVINNAQGYEPGTNVTELSVLSPFEATKVTVDGSPARVAPLLEGSFWRHTVRVPVPSGGSTRVEFDLVGDVATGDVYRLRFGGQALLNEGSTRVSVETTEGVFAPGPEIKVQGGKAIVTLSGTGQSILTLRRLQS